MRFGRTMWSYFHGTASRWPCPRCRNSFSAWMEGLHDFVNGKLGKRPFKAESYARFLAGELDGGYHAACFGCRVYRIGAGLLGGFVPRWRAMAANSALMASADGNGRE